MGKKKKRIGNGKIESFPFQSGDIVFEILTKTYIWENRVFFCFSIFSSFYCSHLRNFSLFICLKFFSDSILRFICFSLYLVPKFLKMVVLIWAIFSSKQNIRMLFRKSWLDRSRWCILKYTLFDVQIHSKDYSKGIGILF